MGERSLGMVIYVAMNMGSKESRARKETKPNRFNNEPTGSSD